MAPYSRSHSHIATKIRQRGFTRKIKRHTHTHTQTNLKGSGKSKTIIGHFIFASSNRQFFLLLYFCNCLLDLITFVITILQHLEVGPDRGGGGGRAPLGRPCPATLHPEWFSGRTHGASAPAHNPESKKKEENSSSRRIGTTRGVPRRSEAFRATGLGWYFSCATAARWAILCLKPLPCCFFWSSQGRVSSNRACCYCLHPPSTGCSAGAKGNKNARAARNGNISFHATTAMDEIIMQQPFSVQKWGAEPIFARRTASPLLASCNTDSSPTVISVLLLATSLTKTPGLTNPSRCKRFPCETFHFVPSQ